MSYARSIEVEVHNRPRSNDLGSRRHRSTPSGDCVKQIPQLSGHNQHHPAPPLLSDTVAGILRRLEFIVRDTQGVAEDAPELMGGNAAHKRPGLSLAQGVE